MVKGLLENAGLKRMLNMVYIVTLQIFLVFSGEFKLIHILQVLKITDRCEWGKFLLVPAYPGCPGSKAVKRSLLLLLKITYTNT